MRSRPAPCGKEGLRAAPVHGSNIPEGLPKEPGTYALIFHLPRPIVLVAGALGRIRLSPGYYVYTGSALGPGGLRARLGRHVAGPARWHWHVDYLRARVRPVEIWWQTGAQPREHVWADVLAGLADGAVKGFGVSDCRCRSHLFRFDDRPTLCGFKAGQRAQAAKFRRLEN